MSQSVTSHIESIPDVCGGSPCISGTRIRVQDVYVWHELQGKSADEICSRYPQVTPGDIYAAMAWYWDHREEIHDRMVMDATLVEQMKASCSSPLQQKLAGLHGFDDSISP